MPRDEALKSLAERRLARVKLFQAAPARSYVPLGGKGFDKSAGAVREQVRRGADFIKVMTTGARSVELEDPWPAQLTLPEMTALVEEAHRLGRRVAAHCEGTPGVELALAAGVLLEPGRRRGVDHVLGGALLDALALLPSGVDPAAEDAVGGDTPLEGQLILEHLQRVGLGRAADAAQAKARRVFRDSSSDPDGWVGQWRHSAGLLKSRKSGPEALAEAQDAYARDPSQENWEYLQATIQRMREESPDFGTRLPA